MPNTQKPPTKLGRYQIVRELGKGAMGVVYEGRDPIIGRRVAIKTARRDVMEATGRAEEMMARFLREAAAAGSLNHPNIITIYDASEEQGMAYIAMEYIENGTLQDFMAAKRKLEPERVAQIAAQVCNALAVAHENGIVHRDIKPANIMMLADGTTKVADFGIAHVSDSNLTQEGAMIGTPHFMSPEQFMGQKVDGRSDLFSVGVIIYEMLTGEKPFGGEVLSTVMHRVIKVDPIEPKELNFTVNDTLSKVVMKALNKNPKNRYDNGRDMAAALLESIKENPDPAITKVERKVSSDATTVAIKPGEATVVSSALPDRTPGPDETQPGTPPPRAHDAPPAVAASRPPQPPAPNATVTQVPPAQARKNKRVIAIAAGVAGLIVVATMAGLLLSGGKPSAPPTPGATPATPTATTAVPVTPAAPAAATIAKIDIAIWLADDMDAYAAATDLGNPDYSKCRPDGTADILVTDPVSGDTLAQEKDINSDIIKLSAPKPHVKVQIARDGYTPKAEELFAAKDMGGTVKYVAVLMKKN